MLYRSDLGMRGRSVAVIRSGSSSAGPHTVAVSQRWFLAWYDSRRGTPAYAAAKVASHIAAASQVARLRFIIGRANLDYGVGGAAANAVPRNQPLASRGDEGEVRDPIIGHRRRFIEDVDSDCQHTALLAIAKRSDEEMDFTDDALVLVGRGRGHMKHAFPHFVEPIEASAAALCQLLTRLATSRPWVFELAIRGQEAVRKHFTWARMAAAFSATLEGLAGQSDTRGGARDTAPAHERAPRPGLRG